ncbi:MAG: hypothetical protein Kow0079_15000 [Vicingaceae bacterium]
MKIKFQIKIIIIFLLLIMGCTKDYSLQIKKPTIALGYVVDKNSGAKINNAKVVLSIYDGFSEYINIDSTYTDKEGFYEIKEENLSTRSSLPMEPLGISIIHPDYHNAGTYLEYNSINKYDFKLTKR